MGFGAADCHRVKASINDLGDASHLSIAEDDWDIFGGLIADESRPLEGKSWHCRYIDPRRTLIMLEQSISFAVKAYALSPNGSSTWAAVNEMFDNLLNNL